jgi:hypothetical protein
MHGVDLSVLELFITELTTMLALLKSSKRPGDRFTKGRKS